jgi:hypothetical protein
MKISSFLALSCLALGAAPAFSQEMPTIPAPAIHAPSASGAPSATLVDEEVLALLREKLANEVVLFMIANQNEKYAGMDQAAIDALDKQWTLEREAEKKPLISATLTNPLSSYLTMVQARSNGLFAEMLVMDSKGLNVGQSSVSSDYWQGDEDKWQKTYAVGPEAVFMDEVEFDESNKIWIMQVSLSVKDPENGKPIGAASIDINLSELQRRRAVAASLTF